MNTEAEVKREHVESTNEGHAATVIGLAALGCLVAGGVGILKALSMETGTGVFFCLLGALASFGMVYYIYFGKR